MYKKILRFGVIGILSLLTVLGIVFFSFVPSYADRKYNHVSNINLEPISTSAKELHNSILVADLHADSLLWGRNLSDRSDNGHVDIPRLIEGNVALQVFTVVTKVPSPLLLQGNSDRTDNIIKLALIQGWWPSTLYSLKDRALFQAQRFSKLAVQSPDKFTIIKTRFDLNNYLDRRKSDSQITAGLLGLEGAHALEGDIDNLDLLYRSGFRLIGLAHFFDNEVSGSVHGINRGGLTDFGRDVVKRMEDLGMIIDLAHASSETIDDVLKIAKGPVIVSHTGVKGTCDNIRNLSDRQIQEIARSGGIIGIGFWKTAICGEDVNAIVRSIRYVRDKVGIDYVALGSDYDGGTTVPFDVSKISQITYALQQDGFSDEEIAKVMGLNAIRILQELLPK